jgi:acyl-homoserine lactone synthase
MIRIIEGFTLADPLARAMFADRKRLFVDLLGWNVPVVEGCYEIDCYDNADATYLVALDDVGGHGGSLRLLPTTGPHILGDLFPELCEGGVPRGTRIFEITRLCLPPRLGAAARLLARKRLISAMIDHARAEGIVGLTGVVTEHFLGQVLAMGWRCAALGAPRHIDGARLGAFRIALGPDTPRCLAETGIYMPDMLTAPPARRAA